METKALQTVQTLIKYGVFNTNDGQFCGYALVPNPDEKECLGIKTKAKSLLESQNQTISSSKEEINLSSTRLNVLPIPTSSHDLLRYLADRTGDSKLEEFLTNWDGNAFEFCWLDYCGTLNSRVT